MVGCVDPYCLLETKGKGTSVAVIEWMNWPDVMYANNFNYLILTPGYSYEQLKAYKRA